MTFPTAKLSLSRVHVKLTIAKSSNDALPLITSTLNGNVTFRFPPMILATGDAFFSVRTKKSNKI